MYKVLNLFLIISFMGFSLVSCSDKKTEKLKENESVTSPVKEEDPYAIDEKAPAKAEVASGIIDGINAKQIFKQSCTVCHGVDGKLGANGSKDLSQSVLTIEEKVNIITNGKGLMIAFEQVLSPEEIKAVAQYTEQLKG